MDQSEDPRDTQTAELCPAWMDLRGHMSPTWCSLTTGHAGEHQYDRVSKPALSDAEFVERVDAMVRAGSTDTIEIKLPDLSRVALEPGDKLLVRVPRHVTAMDAALISEKLQHHFPGHYVVVVPKELELSVVRPMPAKEGEDGSD